MGWSDESTTEVISIDLLAHVSRRGKTRPLRKSIKANQGVSKTFGLGRAFGAWSSCRSHVKLHRVMSAPLPLICTLNCMGIFYQARQPQGQISSSPVASLTLCATEPSLVSSSVGGRPAGC